MNEQAIKDVLVQVLGNLVREVRAQKEDGIQKYVTDPIPVELSARHAHLSEADVMTLFSVQ